MSYNKEQLSTYLQTAGKISVLTAFGGVVIFSLIFLLNIGASEFKHVGAAQIATTSVTVLNTPPAFDAGPFETPESSTTTPTNSGDSVVWTAVAIDPSNEDYFLLVCDGETASPTARAGQPPICGAGDLQWAVSATTSSGALATAATTTVEAAPFAESNDWFAWVCDSAAINPRCNSFAQQGTGSTSSPFNMNSRPSFAGIWDDSPADPGTTVNFNATSSDADTSGAPDTVQLFICDTPSFNSTSTIGCNGLELASSTAAASDPIASYALAGVIQDDDYPAYAFVVDNHGHEATGGAHGTDSVLTVNNVAPTIPAGQINLNDGGNISLVEGIESTNFSLTFEVSDANSCDAVGGANNYDEVTNFSAAVYRSGIGSSTCNGVNGVYDPNNCYPSSVATTTWNIACTASTTSCTFDVDGVDTTLLYECTFPLWFVADPTSGGAADSFYFAEDWRAAITGEDDDAATSTIVQSTISGIEVNAVTAINLVDTSIPYGALEPGQNTVTLNASTTAESTGNTGLDHNILGQSMCNGYETGNPCVNSATATIPAAEQQYATTSVAYGSGFTLSSTTGQLFEINIPKSTSTSTPASDETFWGIAIPASITFAGSYTGENTFIAVSSDPASW